MLSVLSVKSARFGRDKICIVTVLTPAGNSKTGLADATDWQCLEEWRRAASAAAYFLILNLPFETCCCVK